MTEPTCRLMLGDCLERMAEIKDGSVDMVLADPPYGTTACKWDSVIDLPAMWAHLKRVTKPRAAIVMTAAQPFTTTLIASNMRDFRYSWVWEKTNPSGFLNAKRQPMRAHEDVVVFATGQTAYNPQKTDGHKDLSGVRYASVKSAVYGVSVEGRDSNTGTLRYPRSVIQIASMGKNAVATRLHPAQKPVALMEYMIRTYTQPGETVLDFTMGSGTTGVAARNLGRAFVGIEMDAGYFGIAERRIADDTTRPDPGTLALPLDEALSA